MSICKLFKSSMVPFTSEVCDIDEVLQFLQPKNGLYLLWTSAPTNAEDIKVERHPPLKTVQRKAHIHGHECE